MDNSPDGIAPEEHLAPLSYDDTVAYEEQLPTESERGSLANRIGTTKVYLLSETTVATRPSKRRHDDVEDGDELLEEEDMDQDTTYRTNALLLHGPPIADMPTARIFAYATHFDSHPLALEWVDDNTCVLVFKSKSTAQSGFRALQKTAMEEPDEYSFIFAKPIPVALWPPEKRINNSLGKGEGLKGAIQMRWALHSDMKKKGARKESQFYRKHGDTAGKELFDGRDLPPVKRRRQEDELDHMQQKAQLDEELDNFLAEDEEEVVDPEPGSPPSRMRSDYIAGDGRTLLERTSLLRIHPVLEPDLASRLEEPVPSWGGRLRSDVLSMDSSQQTRTRDTLEWGKEDRPRRNVRRNNEGTGRRSGRGEKSRRSDRTGRPQKTQQELDDELDAFLKAGN